MEIREDIDTKDKEMKGETMSGVYEERNSRWTFSNLLI